MSRAGKRADIRKQLQPFADELADRLADMITDHVNGLLEQARAYAIEKLRAALEGPRCPAQDAETPQAKANPEAERKAQALRRGPRRCSKCGAVGFTAQGCGRTHKPSTSPASTTDPRTNATCSPATSPIPREERLAEIRRRAERTPPPPANGEARLPAPLASFDL